MHTISPSTRNAAVSNVYFFRFTPDVESFSITAALTLAPLHTLMRSLFYAIVSIVTAQGDTPHLDTPHRDSYGGRSMFMGGVSGKALKCQDAFTFIMFHCEKKRAAFLASALSF